MWTISLPLQVAVSKNKDFPLNLNQYRNAHFQTLNKAKVEFTDLAKQLIKKAGIPRLARLSLEYIVYPGTAQLLDISNICSIADKFFSDTLKAAGVIADDNYRFLSEIQFRFGGIDRENPRVDVVIRDPAVLPEVLKESEQLNMKISTVVTLTTADMSQALREFIVKGGVTVPDGELQLTLDSGAGYQVRFEKGDEVPAPETKPHGKKAKMDPKAAMEKLQEKLATSATCPDCGVALTAENSSKSAKDGRLLHVACPKTGSEKPAADLPFDPTSKEAAPTLLVASAAPAPAQAVPVPDVAKEPEVTPPPPAKSSLFANFKRPSNEPATK